MRPEAKREPSQLHYEKAWLKPYTDVIPGWEDLAYTHRYLCRVEKEFLLWRLDDNLEPVALNRYKASNFTVTPDGGVMTLRSASNPDLRVYHEPVELPEGGLYVWLPAFFDLRYAPVRYDEDDPRQRLLSWRFCVKCSGNPELPERYRAGQTYLTEFGEFRKLWPNSPL